MWTTAVAKNKDAVISRLPISISRHLSDPSRESAEEGELAEVLGVEIRPLTERYRTAKGLLRQNRCETI